MLKPALLPATLVAVLAPVVPMRAEPSTWIVEGTADLFQPRWDRSKGSLVALVWPKKTDEIPAWKVVQVDPVTFARKERYTSLSSPADAARSAGGLVVLADGAVEFVESCRKETPMNSLVRICPDGIVTRTEIRTNRLLEVEAMVIAPDGTHYLLDWSLRVLARLVPPSESKGGKESTWLDLDPLAGWSGDDEDQAHSSGEEDKDEEVQAGPLNKLLDDRSVNAIAMTRSGHLLIIDNHDFIFKAIPPAPDGTPEWKAVHVAGRRGEIYNGADHADARDMVLSNTYSCVVDADDRIFVMDEANVLEFVPYQEGGTECWRPGVVAGRARPSGVRRGTLPPCAVPSRRGTAASRLRLGADNPFLLDVLPGRAMLLGPAYKSNDIWLLGPDHGDDPNLVRDGALASRVREYVDLKATGDTKAAGAVMASLVKLRDQPERERYDYPFRFIAKSLFSLPKPGPGEPEAVEPRPFQRISRELQREAGSTLVEDWRVTRFRAAVAIQATGDGKLNPPPGSTTVQPFTEPSAKRVGIAGPETKGTASSSSSED